MSADAVGVRLGCITSADLPFNLISGLMKAWKSSSFKVPYLLSKGSNLGGSRRVSFSNCRSIC